MEDKIRIEDLTESNIEDLISVCSSKRMDDPIHRQGVNLKRQWLREMLRKYGSVAKIAYFEDKPVAQIFFYPEESDLTNASPRKNVLRMLCIYNPATSAQKHGIGTKLLQSLVSDAKKRKTCLGNKPCKFILVKAFNTGEFLPMPEFFKKNGFLPTPENEEMLYYPVEGNYEQTSSMQVLRGVNAWDGSAQVEGNYEQASPMQEYEPLPEDRGRAVILYSPVCQFSYQFAKKMEEQIREVAPNLPIDLINEWEKPEEAIKRRNNVLIVNAKPIRTFFMDSVKFKEEVRLALSEKR